ncbi:DUF2062 domain-containing protein [Candidatus Methylacidiphilum fumarolicum]|uniref:DUF2062 domain-containing protein n=2 Tax=Candidatus Methylacidiphilum fumarolicum TaxID=591154 RepID=I0K015_METFB|nr:DUF2062 domain-containing protein [Candidatus Methylacidiphilum fumarolicum]MBW6415141.1 DUF2062 domain-containing protein [Candidatus Methylacidiphilum fumarolicum]TFE65979.1 hypothetical protein A7K73_02120 [Candidatus Methylacidiphilum fumarolicum]TFE72709.1 DUF2062 domain-containing protein [Candidatus Methylacidiphilum fumarolicum]TFE73175.1 DUF2062 domain-containing protein [Candidatus Methylacidiphilum fumarolicum]TFE77579.1 hypothetical protein A7D33_04190 [Candidatus Methylacidiphi
MGKSSEGVVKSQPKKKNLFSYVSHHFKKSHTILRKLPVSAHSIAFGFAIGVFYGFTPFWGFKTILAIVSAWLVRASKVAAAVGVAAHDIALPFVPGLMWLEYKIGLIVLGQNSHQFNKTLSKLQHLELKQLISWQEIYNLGWPMFIGSLIIGLPLAAISYILVFKSIKKYQEIQKAEEESTHPS